MIEDIISAVRNNRVLSNSAEKSVLSQTVYLDRGEWLKDRISNLEAIALTFRALCVAIT